MCLKEILQRSTLVEMERFRVPDLSRSNWVSDLLPLLLSSDKTMCGQCPTCVCYINLTVFSFQNEDRVSCFMRETVQKEGVLAGHRG